MCKRERVNFDLSHLSSTSVIYHTLTLLQASYHDLSNDPSEPTQLVSTPPDRPLPSSPLLNLLDLSLLPSNPSRHLQKLLKPIPKLHIQHASSPTQSLPPPLLASLQSDSSFNSSFLLSSIRSLLLSSLETSKIESYCTGTSCGIRWNCCCSVFLSIRTIPSLLYPVRIKLIEGCEGIVEPRAST